MQVRLHTLATGESPNEVKDDLAHQLELRGDATWCIAASDEASYLFTEIESYQLACRLCSPYQMAIGRRNTTQRVPALPEYSVGDMATEPIRDNV